jgi:hypothetical protein
MARGWQSSGTRSTWQPLRTLVKHAAVGARNDNAADKNARSDVPAKRRSSHVFASVASSFDLGDLYQFDRPLPPNCQPQHAKSGVRQA